MNFIVKKIYLPFFKNDKQMKNYWSLVLLIRTRTPCDLPTTSKEVYDVLFEVNMIKVTPQRETLLKILCERLR